LKILHEKSVLLLREPNSLKRGLAGIDAVPPKPSITKPRRLGTQSVCVGIVLEKLIIDRNGGLRFLERDLRLLAKL
jgi:hypothetical protein